MLREDTLRLQIVSVYQDFYRSITLNNDYVLPDNDMNRLALDSFVSYIESRGNRSIGLDWIIDFIELSFHWWYKREKTLKYGLQSIKLSWIIGKPAIKRHDELKSTKSYAASFFRGNMRQDVGMSIRNKYRKFESHLMFNKMAMDTNKLEESYKKQLYGTPEGLLWCIANTTLYKDSSSLCSNCVSRTRCKDLLKREYPSMYSKRGL